MIRKSIIILLLFYSGAVFSQETQNMLDPDFLYKNAEQLFLQENYLAARKEFERYLAFPQEKTNAAEYLRKSNAEYYIAAIAEMNNYEDAEKLMLNYITAHHETYLRRKIYFNLGRYYHKQKEYTDAIAYLERADVKDLTNDELIQYHFMLGYNYFVKKNFAQAKKHFQNIKAVQGDYYAAANYYYGYISFDEKDYNDALSSFLIIKDDPTYKDVVPYYLAQLYFQKKDYDKVIELASPYLNDQSNKYTPKMSHLVGQSYYYKKDYQQAEPLIRTYIEQAESVTEEEMYQLAFAEYKNGRYAKAIDHFKPISLKNTALGQNAAYNLADCYLKLDNKESARAAFLTASQADFDKNLKEQSLQNYIKLAYADALLEETVSSASQFIEDYPKSAYLAEISEILADALLRTKNYPKAISVIEGLSTKSPKIKKAYQLVTYYRAVQLYNDKDYDGSMQLLYKSLQEPIEPNIQALAHFLRSEILFNNGNYEQSIIEAGKYLQLANSRQLNDVNVYPADAYYNQGYAYMKQGKYTSAITPFSNAIKEVKQMRNSSSRESLLADSYLRLADAQFVLKQFDQSIANYKEAEKYGNKVDYIQYQTAMAYGYLGNANAKVNILSGMEKNFPGSLYGEKALFEAGLATNQDLQQPAQSIPYFQKMISNYPNGEYAKNAYMMLGLVNYNLGNQETALNNYQTVIKKYPNSDESREALKVMQEIYVSQGSPDVFVDFVNQNGMQLSASTQDSLFYRNAEEKYFTAEYAKATQAFNTYLDRFPNGFFAIDANYYLSDCYLHQDKSDAAIPFLEKVINAKPNQFYEKALKKLAYINYELKEDYTKAKNNYEQLYLLTKDKTEGFDNLTQLVRAAYLSFDDKMTLKYTEELINHPAADYDLIMEARYYKAMTLLDQNQWAAAQGEFEILAGGPSSAQTAEANYYLCEILYKQDQFKKSLDKCFDVKDKVSGYTTWLVKLYILMSDNYYALGDKFQAKATLESIIQNYEKEDELKQEARSKLQKLVDEELSKTKLKSNVQSDSTIIQFED